jgi:hypothetical protein
MENQEQIEEAAAQDTFPLDDAAIGIIAEIHQQMEPLQLQLQTVLGYFARQHKLKGKWQLAPNRKELIKASQ